MATVTCPCGTRFEAASTRARYCSAKCRKRGSRAGLVVAARPADQPAPAPVEPVDGEIPSVVGATIRELSEARALSTASGLAAVQLARLIDAATPMMGSSVAAWSRELRACLVEAKQAAPEQDVDPLDELEARRAKRA